jgi:hypothetical protein
VLLPMPKHAAGVAFDVSDLLRWMLLELLKRADPVAAAAAAAAGVVLNPRAVPLACLNPRAVPLACRAGAIDDAASMVSGVVPCLV